MSSSFGAMNKKLGIGIRAPHLMVRKLYQVKNSLGPSYNARGIDVMEQDWDNLIILDACRTDMFRETITLEGSLETVISRGSSTIEFLRGNFADRSMQDTVYVTANPQYYRNRKTLDAEFHEVYDIWAGDGWNSDLGTVLPSTTTDRALCAHEKHGDKRLIVHYMQPHYPFIHSETEFDKGHLETEDADKFHLWMQLATGQLDKSIDSIWDDYQENLRRVLSEVETLVQRFDGKTVITSDHGNVFGERVYGGLVREYGHPPGVYCDPLVRVPWFTVPFDQRRDIKVEQQAGSVDNVDDSVVEERLASLGYVD